ncbi:MAG: sigma-70 family RNA polymerase sigma factor [Pirellulaceae bacterium]
MMTEQREALVERIRSGDTDALADFLNLMRPQLLAFIDRQIGAALRRKVEPEDIFQEVSADAVRSLADVDLAERDPFSWLCQVADRRIKDAARFFDAQKRDAAREVPLGTPGGSTGQAGLINMLVASLTTPSQAFSRNAREMRLLDALGQLPEEQREALRLRYVENLPTKQIADQIGKTDAAVRVMLSRSLKKLQGILGGEASA